MKGERREWRGRGRLYDDRASSSVRRCDCRGDHGGWKVPGRNRRYNSDRLLKHQSALRDIIETQHIAVNAPRLFREPRYKTGRVADFRSRFAQRLPLDRKSVVSGKSVSVRVDLGGRRIITKKKNTRKRIMKYKET